MTIAGDTIECRSGLSAVASVGLPFTSAVTEASEAVPYIGVELKPDPAIVSELILGMSDDMKAPSRAIVFEKADHAIVGSLSRLMGLLDAPDDIPFLARLYERELYYRMLQTGLGNGLRQIGQNTARFAQIKSAAEWIGEHPDHSLRIREISGRIGMSVTSFHRHFKAVTGQTPLEYQRQFRMLEARGRIASGSQSVTSVAYAVGYGSASQFSREYKRNFGRSPIEDRRLLFGVLQTE